MVSGEVMQRRRVRRFRGFWRAERRRAATYRALAGTVQGSRRRTLLTLAAGEERHARHWAQELDALGIALPKAPPAPPLRGGRALVWLARLVGLTPVVPLLERAEAGEAAAYLDERRAPEALLGEEEEHARLVSELSPAWRARAAGSLRAGVFGVNDGLVSNLALVMGVVGGTGPDEQLVVLTGLAGLAAGSLSMAAGEWISVRNQLELLEGRAGTEEDLTALGTAWRAALSSFLLFAAGAALPVLPFVLGSGPPALVAALVLPGVALFTVGAALSVLTGRPALASGLRQLAIGAAATAVTFALGTLIGGAIG